MILITTDDGNKILSVSVNEYPKRIKVGVPKTNNPMPNKDWINENNNII